MKIALVIDQRESHRAVIHLEKYLNGTVFCTVIRFDLLVNGVFLCYGCERVELEDESSVADAMWELIRRWKRTVVASLPMDLNLTD